jgi:hypothetical protein
MTTRAEMEAIEFPRVLSADPSLAGDIWKYKLHDDTGPLTISEKRFFYQGVVRKLDIRWENVQNVRIGKQDAPWALHAVCAALAGAAFLAGSLASGDFVTMFFILLPVFGALYRWVRETSLVSWVVVDCGPADHPQVVWMTEAVRWWDSSDGAQKLLAAFKARLPSNVVS